MIFEINGSKITSGVGFGIAFTGHFNQLGSRGGDSNSCASEQEYYYLIYHFKIIYQIIDLLHENGTVKENHSFIQSYGCDEVTTMREIAEELELEKNTYLPTGGAQHGIFLNTFGMSDNMKEYVRMIQTRSVNTIVNPFAAPVNVEEFFVDTIEHGLKTPLYPCTTFFKSLCFDRYFWIRVCSCCTVFSFFFMLVFLWM